MATVSGKIFAVIPKWRLRMGAVYVRFILAPAYMVGLVSEPAVNRHINALAEWACKGVKFEFRT
jgi:hypothetical protein